MYDEMNTMVTDLSPFVLLHVHRDWNGTKYRKEKSTVRKVKNEGY